MVIKRLTIEVDDSSDPLRPTTVPESLRVAEPELKARNLTGPPSEAEADETNSPQVGHAPPRAIGRTVADLVAEFVNDPRAMATLLMFAPFVVFVVKIEEFADLTYPLVVGVLLNAVWFGVSWMQYIRGRKSDT